MHRIVPSGRRLVQQLPGGLKEELQQLWMLMLMMLYMMMPEETERERACVCVSKVRDMQGHSNR